MTGKLVWLIPIAALAAALLHMPYGYYMLLRLLVCESAPISQRVTQTPARQDGRGCSAASVSCTTRFSSFP